MSDAYILKIINKYSHGSQHRSTVMKAKTKLDPKIKAWAGKWLESTIISGSFAKGTAITLGSDFDIFISLKHDLPTSLKDIYNSLYKWLNEKRLPAKKQNVSLRIKFDNIKVDVIPAKKRPGHTNYHSIYLSRKDTWTQTNVQQHINIVKNSGRRNEIRITKIWSKLHNLDFPSFYLELAVINALKGRPTNTPESNFLKVLHFISTKLKSERIVDPTNSNNIISDILTNSEKETIAKKAKEGYEAKYWSSVIW